MISTRLHVIVSGNWLLGRVLTSQATVDLPQFLAIARTLWPEITTADAVSVFRDAHEDTKGEVDYQVPASRYECVSRVSCDTP